MIFGKAMDESNNQEQWFAWYPVRLQDNRIAWLQRVLRWVYWDVRLLKYIYMYGETKE